MVRKQGLTCIICSYMNHIIWYKSNFDFDWTYFATLMLVTCVRDGFSTNCAFYWCGLQHQEHVTEILNQLSRSNKCPQHPCGWFLFSGWSNRIINTEDAANLTDYDLTDFYINDYKEDSDKNTFENKYLLCKRTTSERELQRKQDKWIFA